jgi:hypothetical protein
MGGAKDEQGDSRDEPKVTIIATTTLIVPRILDDRGFAASLPPPTSHRNLSPSRDHGIHPT